MSIRCIPVSERFSVFVYKIMYCAFVYSCLFVDMSGYVGLSHGLINYIDTKTKRCLKILACKGTLRHVFIRVYRLETHAVILAYWSFRPSFVSYCPFNLLSGSPPPPSLCQVPYIQTVSGWEGVLSPVGDHSLQEFNTLCLTRFRTYKIAGPPPNKNLGGEGASDR
jgi:hypothetical protein